MWGVLQWRTDPGLEIDYAISLRLYNAEGERVNQEDAVLWDADHWPTSYWSADQAVETMALLHLPADLPPGEYELRLVVYDVETQTPTVQIGCLGARDNPGAPSADRCRVMHVPQILSESLTRVASNTSTLRAAMLRCRRRPR